MSVWGGAADDPGLGCRGDRRPTGTAAWRRSQSPAGKLLLCFDVRNSFYIHERDSPENKTSIL